MDKFITVLLLWALAWIFSAIQDRIQFRFSESVFAYIRNEKVRAWFAGKFTNNLKKKLPMLPMIWDGWHAAKWFKWLMLFLGFCMYDWNSAGIFAITGAVMFNGFYHVLLRRKAKPGSDK